MSTLIVFRLPDNTYVSGSLDLLSHFPQKGHSYLLGGKVYETIEVVEPLGVGGGNQQLLDLINLDQQDVGRAAQALATMGSLDKPGSTNIATQPDHVVLVRLGKGKTSGSGKVVLKTSALVDQSHGGDADSKSGSGKRGSRRRRKPSATGKSGS